MEKQNGKGGKAKCGGHGQVYAVSTITSVFGPTLVLPNMSVPQLTFPKFSY